MSSQPGDLRLANSRRVLIAALYDWPCTKPELSRRTGLSQMTVGKVVDQLLDQGLLDKAAGDGGLAHGRPPLHVSPGQRIRFVGIEIGVRETVIYRIGLGGEPARANRQVFATPADLPPLREAWCRWREATELDDLECVLVAVPGVLETRQPSIVYSPNLHWTEGTALFRALEQDFGAAVIPVQEAQAMTLGHLTSREASDNFLLVDLGDGIGGTVVNEGRLLGGPLPFSGEIGHSGVQGNGRRCGCGAIGCIETLAGRGGLIESFRRNSGRHGADWDDMARALDGASLPVWLDESLDSLAVVVASALNLLGFFEAVFVGELTTLHVDVMPRLNERLQQHTLLGRFGKVEARWAPMRRQLGLLAAAVERRLLPNPATEPLIRPALH